MLSAKGAYSSSSVYTTNDVKEIVTYAAAVRSHLLPSYSHLNGRIGSAVSTSSPKSTLLVTRQSSQRLSRSTSPARRRHRGRRLPTSPLRASCVSRMRRPATSPRQCSRPLQPCSPANSSQLAGTSLTKSEWPSVFCYFLTDNRCIAATLKTLRLRRRWLLATRPSDKLWTPSPRKTMLHCALRARPPLSGRVRQPRPSHYSFAYSAALTEMVLTNPVTLSNDTVVM